MNRNGEIKMCDFGISGRLVDSVAKTIEAGSKPYMAVSLFIFFKIVYWLSGVNPEVTECAYNPPPPPHPNKWEINHIPKCIFILNVVALHPKKFPLRLHLPLKRFGDCP